MDNLKFFDVHRIYELGFSVFNCIYTHINYIFYGETFATLVIKCGAVAIIATYLYDTSRDHCLLDLGRETSIPFLDDTVIVEINDLELSRTFHWFKTLHRGALHPYQHRLYHLSVSNFLVHRGRHNQIGSSHGEITEGDDMEPEPVEIIVPQQLPPNNIAPHIPHEDCFICTAPVTRRVRGAPIRKSDKFRFHRDDRHFSCFQCACVMFHRAWREADRSNVGIQCPSCRTMTFTDYNLMNPEIVDRALHPHFIPYVRPEQPQLRRQADPIPAPAVPDPVIPHVNVPALIAGIEGVMAEMVAPPAMFRQDLDDAFDNPLPPPNDPIEVPVPPPEVFNEDVVLYTNKNKFHIITSTINWKIVMLIICIFVAGDPVIQEGLMGIFYSYLVAVGGFGTYIAMSIKDYLAPELNYIQGAMVIYRGVRDAAWYLRALYFGLASFGVALTHIYVNSSSIWIVRCVLYYSWCCRWLISSSYLAFIAWAVVQQHFATNGGEYVVLQSELFGWPILFSRVVSIPGYTGYITIRIRRDIVDRVLIRRAASANSSSLGRFIVNDVFTDPDAVNCTTREKHLISMYIYQSIVFMRSSEPSFTIPSNNEGVGNLRW